MNSETGKYIVIIGIIIVLAGIVVWLFHDKLHDDYLKWICGFANAQGGVIFIGRDDNGNVLLLSSNQLSNSLYNSTIF